jgi:hypothetical protein
MLHAKATVTKALSNIMYHYDFSDPPMTPDDGRPCIVHVTNCNFATKGIHIAMNKSVFHYGIYDMHAATECATPPVPAK